MKTILYNPIFINPQAYYVFPRLTRYLQPDNESTSEPANYIGTIEVKVIAYGDTTLKRTYTNTDSIDLSEFKNTWIRISLFTKVGSCVLGEWKIGNMESDLPYIDPEVLASLKAVVIVGNKTNNDSDRAIVKNLVDASNPFVISNAAYDKMSSYGGYEFAKFDNTLDWYNTEGNDSVEVVSRNGHSITLKRLTGPNFWYFQNSTFRGLISNVIPFKVNSNKNITVIWDVHGLSISEGKDKSVRVQELVLNPNEDNYTNLKTLNEEELAQIDISTNSLYYVLWFDLSTLAVDEEVTIEMLPLFEGAFVTDGIDDLITSTKTVQEMGITDEVTVVSMIHQIDLNSTYTIATTNYIENSNSREHVRSDVYNYGKTGIYGYSASLINNTKSDIKNILGDEADYYVKSTNSLQTIFDAKFSVVGRISELTEASQVAWYWTIIANKVLTTDQINQVIAYFNLDRTLKPDILCDVKKQGITNENHAEFGDKLIDYSGNGRDIQLNNIAWKGDSGIGKYSADFESFDWAVNISQKQHNKATISLNGRLCNHTAIEVDEMKVNIIGNITELIYWYIANPDDTTRSEIRLTSGINTLPKSYAKDDGQTYNIGFAYISGDSEITIEQIPSHAGALCLDGVNDFGQFVGDLGLKDYTFIADRAYDRIVLEQAPFIASKSTNGQAPFLMEYLNSDNYVYPHSFGATTKTTNLNIQRQISYQSTYVYNGNSISKGTSVDTGDGLTIGNSGSTGAQYSPLCLWSLMLFPYSMSEFLIERQLKKHKLGTLYPDMVEFRPIIKHDDRITAIKYYHIKGSSWINLKPGDYIPVGSKISITTNLKSPYTIANVMSSSLTDIKVVPSAGGGNAYDILGYVTDKSPQKITMDIQTK